MESQMAISRVFEAVSGCVILVLLGVVYIWHSSEHSAVRKCRPAGHPWALIFLIQASGYLVYDGLATPTNGDDRIRYVRGCWVLVIVLLWMIDVVVRKRRVRIENP